jgi:hypothetical protein
MVPPFTFWSDARAGHWPKEQGSPRRLAAHFDPMVFQSSSALYVKRVGLRRCSHCPSFLVSAIPAAQQHSVREQPAMWICHEPAELATPGAIFWRMPVTLAFSDYFLLLPMRVRALHSRTASRLRPNQPVFSFSVFDISCPHISY